MKSTIFVAVFLALVLAANAAPALFFCQDSQWDSSQPAFPNLQSFYQERASYKQLRDFFSQITANVDLGNKTVEADIIAQLNAKLAAMGFDNTDVSFTITRSNGDITMDTQLGVNPALDNHGGRYSIGKPMLCRDWEALVFDFTYVTRTGLQYRFWSQAVQTSVQQQWFVFRFNIPVR